MRPAPLLVAPAVLLALAGLAGLAAAAPGSAPDVRYVSADQAEARCKPSDKPDMYPTNRLRRGDPVEVVGEEAGGWLKIRPPRGSFSWVNTFFLHRISPNQPYEVVITDDVAVPVYVGSEIQKGRPTVVGTTLKRGTQVKSIGQPLADEAQGQPGLTGTWMPIEPPEGEYRYVRADVVSKTPPAGGAVTAARPPAADSPSNSTFLPTAGTRPVPAPAGPAPASGSHPILPVPDLQALYNRALEAQNGKRLPEAIQLWEQVATVAQSQGNAPYAAQASAHARALSDLLRGGPAGQTLPSETRYPTPVAPGPRPPAQADPTVRLAAPTGTAPGIGAPDYTAPAAPPTPGAAAGNLPGSGPGRLRHAGRTVEYQRTYVLENNQGLPLLYVTPQPGIDLEPYVDHAVELFGPTCYRGDIRAYYMTVARVQPLP